MQLDWSSALQIFGITLAANFSFHIAKICFRFIWQNVSQKNKTSQRGNQSSTAMFQGAQINNLFLGGNDMSIASLQKNQSEISNEGD